MVNCVFYSIIRFMLTTIYSRLFFSAVFVLTSLSAQVVAQPQLTLEEAVSIARNNDLWLDRSHLQEQAVVAQSVIAGTLPDPVVSFGFVNLPTDSFDFGQEPMTQFKVGVSQMFPSGKTRQLKRRQLREQGDQHQMRKDRLAKVTVIVSHLWLESYRNREAIRLIKKDRTLFERLVDVAELSYTNATGKTQQQDLVRAQLELTRLDDRLTMLQQQQEISLAKLSEWLPSIEPANITLADTLPKLSLNNSFPFSAIANKSEQLAQVLFAHPKIKSLDQKIVTTGTGVELAKQKYKLQWKINASYGYRNDDPLGNERSDFFSLGVSFNVPLFTSSRQDREVQAAQATESAVKTEKALALRSMRSSFKAAQSRLESLNQRKTLYEKRLLKEVNHQAEASLTAYTNNTEDFAEMVRARIAELNANIDFLDINIDRLKTIVELNYFLAPVQEDSIEG